MANDNLHCHKIQEALDKGCKRVSQITAYTGLGRTTVERLLARIQRTDILPKSYRTVRPKELSSLEAPQVAALFEELGPEPHVLDVRLAARKKYGVELLDTTVYRWMRQAAAGKAPVQARDHSRARLLNQHDLARLAAEFVDDPHFTIPQLLVALSITHPGLSLSRQSLYNYSRRIKAMALDLNLAKHSDNSQHPPEL
jgi:transposase